MNRATVENILVRRCKAALEMVDLSTSISGTNSDLDDPMWGALKRLGYAVASTTVSDSDIAQLDTGDENAFLDIAELRTLETIYNAAVGLVDMTIGPRHESLSQFGARLEKVISDKRQQISLDYGNIFGNGLESGTFSVASVEDGSNVY